MAAPGSSFVNCTALGKNLDVRLLVTLIEVSPGRLIRGAYLGKLFLVVYKYQKKGVKFLNKARTQKWQKGFKFSVPSSGNFPVTLFAVHRRPGCFFWPRLGTIKCKIPRPSEVCLPGSRGPGFWLDSLGAYSFSLTPSCTMQLPLVTAIYTFGVTNPFLKTQRKRQVFFFKSQRKGLFFMILYSEI